jgi:LacI family transcriptional regulator
MLARWPREHPEPIGLMIYNGDRAGKMLNACVAAELHVPDDVVVVGIDNDQVVCVLSEPPLSSE